MIVALTADHRAPSRGKTQEGIVAFGSDCCNPVVHSSIGRVCRDEFCQRRAKETLEDEDEDEAVDDCRCQYQLRGYIQGRKEGPLRAPGPPALMAVIRPSPRPEKQQDTIRIKQSFRRIMSLAVVESHPSTK